MPRAKARNRPLTQLSPRLDKGLLGYATSAAAAGVGLLALAQPADAKVIYTPSHIPIPSPGFVHLDLNHDGITDFSFSAFSLTSKARHPPAMNGQFGLEVRGARSGNSMIISSKICAAELRRGDVISSAKHFEGGNDFFRMWSFAFSTNFPTGRFTGPWVNAGGFLGLKFLINGETHFGWAHVTITANIFANPGAFITGYAFEDEPNTPIAAGVPPGADERSSAQPDSAPTPTLQPATLGHLAAGAWAVPLWRGTDMN
jgi:hypothetical protein